MRYADKQNKNDWFELLFDIYRSILAESYGSFGNILEMFNYRINNGILKLKGINVCVDIIKDNKAIVIQKDALCRRHHGTVAKQDNRAQL